MEIAIYIKVIEYGEEMPALIQFYWAKSGSFIYEQMVHPDEMIGDWPDFADKRIRNLGIKGRRARLDIIKAPFSSVEKSN